MPPAHVAEYREDSSPGGAADLRPHRPHRTVQSSASSDVAR